MTFFQKNRQRIAQHQFPRRNGGFTAPQVVMHTFEAPPTTSAAAGANYLITRTSYGSYHWLSGAASVGDNIHLAPWSHETWHSTPNNNWAVGISCMARAADWNRYTAAQRRNLVHGMALGAHRFSRWCVSVGKGPVPARRITRAQAMRKEAGFISHGEMDPGRRSDPGATFPWQMFFDEYRRLEGAPTGGGSTTPTPAPTPKPDPTPERTWFDMATEADLRRVVRQEIRETGISISGQTRAALDTDSVSLASLARYGGASLFEGRNQHADVRTRLAALTAAVQALSASVDVNPKDVTDAIDKAVAAALADLKVTLTTEGD